MVNLIKKILRIKPKPQSKQESIIEHYVPINFELKCGAKAIGRIIEWSGCGKADCEHCGPMREQVRGAKVDFKLDTKSDVVSPDLSKMAPKKVRKLKGDV